MKTKTLITVLIGIAVFTIFVGVAMSSIMNVKNPLSVTVASQEEKLCCAGLKIDRGTVSENSIYQLESKWKNTDNQIVLLNSLMGKKEVLAMAYTNCAYACPLILNDMKKIESQLKRNDVNYVLISIDPKRDTPEMLKAFAERNNLDLNKWHLLTGTEEGINELAAVLGFRYQKDSDGNFSHSNIINVLNEKGEISYQHFGLNRDVKDVLNKIKNMKES